METDLGRRPPFVQGTADAGRRPARWGWSRPGPPLPALQRFACVALLLFPVHGTAPAPEALRLPLDVPGYQVREDGLAGDPAQSVIDVPGFELWLRILVAVSFAGLLTVAYRTRVGRLVEMERLRLRIASDLHDDLGANMSSIAMLSRMLQSRPGLDAPDRRRLERISAAADEAMVSLRDVIWLVDPRHDALDQLVDRMRAVAANLFAEIQWRFTVADDLPRRKIDPAVMRNIFLAYKEAVTNAARHSGASRVEIEVARKGAQVTVTVSDDGVGFHAPGLEGAEEALMGGRGLATMRRRAVDVGGDLEIESQPGAGTRITFAARIS